MGALRAAAAAVRPQCLLILAVGLAERHVTLQAQSRALLAGR